MARPLISHLWVKLSEWVKESRRHWIFLCHLTVGFQVYSLSSRVPGSPKPVTMQLALQVCVAREPRTALSPSRHSWRERLGEKLWQQSWPVVQKEDCQLRVCHYWSRSHWPNPRTNQALSLTLLSGKKRKERKKSRGWIIFNFWRWSHRTGAGKLQPAGQNLAAVFLQSCIEHSHTHLFTYCRCCVCPVTAELSRYNAEHMAHKA